MTTDLARHTAQLPAADEWNTMLQMADVFLQSGLLPSSIKTPAAAVTIIAKGRELGIPALYALSKISIIGGKPACEAELMLAMIYRDHGDNAVIPVETDATHCTMQYKRRGWSEYRTHSFTIEEARAAKLTGKDTWQGYPAAMLRARCISALARIGFPDTLGGMYTPEELGARVVVNELGEVVLDDPGVGQETKPAAVPSLYVTLYDTVEDATTLDELQRAWLEVQGSKNSLTDTQRSTLLTLKNRRRAELEAVPEPEAVPAAAS